MKKRIKDRIVILFINGKPIKFHPENAFIAEVTINKPQQSEQNNWVVNSVRKCVKENINNLTK